MSTILPRPLGMSIIRLNDGDRKGLNVGHDGDKVVYTDPVKYY